MGFETLAKSGTSGATETGGVNWKKKALGAAGMGLGAAGAIYGGVSAYKEGKAEAGMYEHNALLAEAQAKQEEAVTGFKQLRQAEAAERLQGELEVAQGASGGVTTMGSFLMARAEQRVQSELENLGIGYEGSIRAGQLRSQAEMDRMQAKMAKKRGKSAMIGSFMGGGGTLLTGFAATMKDKE